jgi:hypothetical protein
MHVVIDPNFPGGKKGDGLVLVKKWSTVLTE